MKAGIAGAGIVGQLLALELSQAGWQVTLFDQATAFATENCSMTAAGLLTPVSELEKCALIIFQLGIDALQHCWPTILACLQQKIYWQQQGSLLLAHPNDQAELQPFIRKLIDKLPDPAMSCKLLNHQEIIDLEPELRKWENGYYFSQEGCLDNQNFLIALQKFLQDKQVNYNFNSKVQAITPGKISLEQSVHEFDWVFDCRGLGAKKNFQDLRGIRGELIWLYAPEVIIQHPIRLLQPRYSLYVAPRPNSIYIVGASEIESEDKSPISVRTTLELLSAAYYLHSGFAEARIIKTLTQCRPTLNDHLPKIKYTKKFFAINGLYRHGFLIAPALIKDILRYLSTGIETVHYPTLWEKFNDNHLF